MGNWFEQGIEFYIENAVNYGLTEAKIICNNYLDLQVKNKDAEEIEFCKGVFNAMHNSL